MRYNVTFRQTAFNDGDYPAPFTLSSPITINITNDGIAEGVEYFQAQIMETSDRFRVRIGQDTINVTITDSKSYISLYRYAASSPKYVLYVRILNIICSIVVTTYLSCGSGGSIIQNLLILVVKTWARGCTASKMPSPEGACPSIAPVALNRG